MNHIGVVEHPGVGTFVKSEGVARYGEKTGVDYVSCDLMTALVTIQCG